MDNNIKDILGLLPPKFKVDPPKKMGIMIYGHKTGGQLYIGDPSEINMLRKDTARKGNKSILRMKSPDNGNPQ